jgi:uncharacterized protein DUF6328
VAAVSARLAAGTQRSVTADDPVSGEVSPGGSPERGETAEQHADRNFSDLLEELRVAQTGVQILVAFLLTLPVQSGFSRLTPAMRHLYEATLTVAVLAGVLLIAPVAFHRVVFRDHLKEPLVRASHRLALSGLTLLAAALTGAVTLALSIASGWPGAITVGVAVAATILMTWSLWPLRLRARSRRDPARR